MHRGTNSVEQNISINIPNFMKPLNFIITLTKSCNSSLYPWPHRSSPTSFHHISWRFILISHSNFRFCIRSTIFPSSITHTKKSRLNFLLRHTCHMQCQSQPLNIWWLQIIQFLPVHVAASSLSPSEAQTSSSLLYSETPSAYILRLMWKNTM